MCADKRYGMSYIFCEEVCAQRSRDDPLMMIQQMWTSWHILYKEMNDFQLMHMSHECIHQGIVS